MKSSPKSVLPNRRNLRRLYELLGAAAPAGLDLPISAGTGHPEAGGAMRRASA